MTQAVPGAPQGDPTGPGMAIPPAPPGMGVPSMAPPAWPGAVPPLATASGGSGNVPPPPLAPPPAPPAPQPAPAPHGRRAAWLGRTLATIGGMRPDLVDEFPQERRDYIQMAFILFTTALEAFIAAAFAINMAFSKPGQEGLSLDLSVLLLSGLVWALVIFNIDRLMVMGMEGVHGAALVLPALLRAGLAFLIGLVMATPLVLQVFSPEIEQQVLHINKGQLDVAQADVDRLAGEVRDLGKQRQGLIDALDSPGLGVDADPQVQQARAYAKELQDACNAARNDLALELLGQLPKERGGSERGGDGPVADALRKKADTACGEVLTRANEAVKTAEVNAVPTADEIADYRQGIQDQIEQLDVAIIERNKAVEDAKLLRDQLRTGTSGLLTRLEGLEQLTHPDLAGAPSPTPTSQPSASATTSAPDSPAATPAPGTASTNATATAASNARRGALAGQAHWALVALLLSIETLPVLFKVLKQWSAKPSAYECRWKDVDNAVLSRARVADQYELAVGALQAHQPVTQTKAMIDHQNSLNEYMIGEITGVQLVLMQQALADWARQHRVPYTPSAYTNTPPPPPPSAPQSPAGSGTSAPSGPASAGPGNGSASSSRNGSSTSSWTDDIDFTAFDADLNDDDQPGTPNSAGEQRPDDGW